VFNSADSARDHQNDKRRLIEEFRTKPFEELKSRVNERQRQVDQRIGQLLNVLYLSKDSTPIITTASTTSITSNGGTPSALTPTTSEKSRSHMNNFNYPELFTY
jgi:hypothetical protein